MTKIGFRERGQGSILILLHGYGGGVQHWEHVAQNLMTDYRVVIPNLSHLYLSTTHKLTFSEQVQIFAEFIREHFPDQKVSIAGFSFGGAIAWGLASTHPELVKDLVLINPMIVEPIKHFEPLELRFFFNVPLNLKSIYLMLTTPMGRAFLRRAAQIFRDERTEGVTAIDKLHGRKLQFVAHLIHHFAWILRTEKWQGWSQKLVNYRGEVRLIFDTEDLLFSRETYRKFAQQIGCEDIVSLTGGGHLVIKTRPEHIAKFIREFLEGKVAA
ncbi:alpha/beta fold hydrolase [Bdellovibrio sp. HCB2-146]|uniref:alpha/beta fold hydrolase n=1 Tax=Bdellovibrio sp. HCB2-146 TaxID=3394362 RepID=UPI0039BD87D0